VTLKGETGSGVGETGSGVGEWRVRCRGCCFLWSCVCLGVFLLL
jgi:hypothetical protein